jgi:hypothetical protein
VSQDHSIIFFIIFFICQKSLKQKKRDWRKNRLSDLDTSEEEGRWKTKEREQKGDDK